MNTFNLPKDFIELDNRRLREKYKLTEENLKNKLEAQLPEYLISGKTILDLGSCLAAAGYRCLLNGATHYTGVEIQDYYRNTSVNLLSRYFHKLQFDIIKDDILNFIQTTEKTYDVVLASGVLYSFLDPIFFLEKICDISNEYIIIDTRYVPLSPNENETGIVLINRKERMVKAVNENIHDYYAGIGSRMCSVAVDIVLNSKGFLLDENIKVKLSKEFDPYNVPVMHRTGIMAPLNYIVRYKKVYENYKTLNELILEDDKL